MESNPGQLPSKNTRWSTWLRQNHFTFGHAYSIIQFLSDVSRRKLQISGDSSILVFDHLPLVLDFLYKDSWILSISHVDFSMESRNKLHSRLRLWEFPDQYVIEPADGSGAPCLDISRVDASMKLIGSFVFVSSERFLKSINGCFLILFPCVSQIKSRSANPCVFLKSIPSLVWLGCWSFLQVLYI